MAIMKQCPGDDYIEKPFSVDELLENVQKMRHYDMAKHFCGTKLVVDCSGYGTELYSFCFVSSLISVHHNIK